MIKRAKPSKLAAATLGLSLAVSSMAMATTVTTPAKAQKKAASTSSWIKNCREIKGDTDCITAVNIIVTKPRKQRLAGVAVLSKKKTKTDVVLIVLPLGSQLQFGYTLRIDKNEPIKGDFSVCLPDGCHSQIEKSAELIKEMKKGQNLNLIYVNYRRQKINVSVPLKGFTKAYKSKVEIKK